jgi:hypothetical protein
MLEHLETAGRGNFGPGHCKIQTILTNLDQKDRDILLKVLNDPVAYSTNGIYNGLRQAGVKIGYATIDRHRKGNCVCEVTRAR